MQTISTIILLSGFVGAMSAQAGQQNMPTVKDQTTSKDSMKPSTITGCVAHSDARYRLDHAIVATDADVDTQNRPATEASATPKMISYILVGADVKAHLGHKVEVIGTISGDKTSSDIAGIPGMKIVGTLNVKSVKMVSKTCP